MTYRIASPQHFGVHQMDLVLHFGKENVLRRCDHQCIDCFHWEVNLVVYVYNLERPMSRWIYLAPKSGDDFGWDVIQKPQTDKHYIYQGNFN